LINFEPVFNYNMIFTPFVALGVVSFLLAIRRFALRQGWLSGGVTEVALFTWQSGRLHSVDRGGISSFIISPLRQVNFNWLIKSSPEGLVDFSHFSKKQLARKGLREDLLRAVEVSCAKHPLLKEKDGFSLYWIGVSSFDAKMLVGILIDEDGEKDLLSHGEFRFRDIERPKYRSLPMLREAITDENFQPVRIG